MKNWRLFRLAIAVTLAFWLAVISPAPAYADLVKINDLVEKAAEMDGQEVTVVGEAIGDVMLRGETGWVNIHDGSNAIGIFAPSSLLKQIESIGRYHRKGDKVRVTGTFYRMDPKNGGDTDIHARTLEIVERGTPVSHKIEPARLFWAAVWSVSGAASVLIWWRRRKAESQKPV